MLLIKQNVNNFYKKNHQLNFLNLAFSLNTLYDDTYIC